MKWRNLILMALILGMFLNINDVEAVNTWSYITGQSHQQTEIATSNNTRLYLTISNVGSLQRAYSSNSGIGGYSVFETLTGKIRVSNDMKSVWYGYRAAGPTTSLTKYDLSPISSPVVKQSLVYGPSNVGMNKFTDFDVYNDHFISFLSNDGNGYGNWENNIWASENAGASWKKINMPHTSITHIDIYDGDPNCQVVALANQRQLIFTNNFWASSTGINLDITPTGIKFLSHTPVRIAVAHSAGVDIWGTSGAYRRFATTSNVVDMEIIGGVLWYACRTQEISHIDGDYNRGSLLDISGLPVDYELLSIAGIVFEGVNSLVVGTKHASSTNGGLYVNKTYYAGVKFTFDPYNPNEGGMGFWEYIRYIWLKLTELLSKIDIFFEDLLEYLEKIIDALTGGLSEYLIMLFEVISDVLVYLKDGIISFVVGIYGILVELGYFLQAVYNLFVKILNQMIFIANDINKVHPVANSPFSSGIYSIMNITLIWGFKFINIIEIIFTALMIKISRDIIFKIRDLIRGLSLKGE